MTLPYPLTPPECDLQDFSHMKLHVARLRDSDLAAQAHPEGCWYAVLLWCASWHQLPAGSLPDDDHVLARLCNLGRDVRTFRRRRDDALRGWIKCSDGRLYHPVVAEAALAAWKAKLEQRWRTECARIKKANERNKTDDPRPTFEEWMSREKLSPVAPVSPGTSGDVPRDKGSKGEGERKGEGDSDPEAEASGGEPPSPPTPATPIDLKAGIFGAGLAYLLTANLPEFDARSMLGKWRRQFGDGLVIDALAAAQAEAPTDAIPWIIRALETRYAQRRRPNRSAWGPRAGQAGAEPATLDVDDG